MEGLTNFLKIWSCFRVLQTCSRTLIYIYIQMLVIPPSTQWLVFMLFFMPYWGCWYFLFPFISLISDVHFEILFIFFFFFYSCCLYFVVVTIINSHSSICFCCYCWSCCFCCNCWYSYLKLHVQRLLCIPIPIGPCYRRHRVHRARLHGRDLWATGQPNLGNWQDWLEEWLR